jgi:hypothetical protein
MAKDDTYDGLRDRVLIALRGGATVEMGLRGDTNMADVLDMDRQRQWEVPAAVLQHMQGENLLLMNTMPDHRLHWILTKRGRERTNSLPIAAGQPPALQPLTHAEVEQVGRYVAFSTLPDFPGDPNVPKPRDQVGRLALEWRLFRQIADADPAIAEKFNDALARAAAIERTHGEAWRQMQQRGTEP